MTRAFELLDRLLRDRDDESLLGDIAEAYHDRAGREPRWRTQLWLWREVAAVVAILPWRHRTPPPTRESVMQHLVADLGRAVRLLRRAPTFVAITALTLAVGIGAAAAIFSVVNPILLRPLPYPEPDRLVVIWERDDDGSPSRTSFATYADLSRDARTFEHAAVLGSWQPTIAEGGDPERLQGQRVSWSYFRALGVRPALGRDFLRAEDAAGRTDVVVLTNGLWRRRFGTDTGIVGNTIRLGDRPYTVAGVLPADFEDVVAPGTSVYRILGYQAQEPWACRTCRHLQMLARLSDDASLAAAQAEMDARSAALVREHPTAYPAPGTHVVPMHEEITREARPMLLAIFGASALLLLMAIANVGALQIARAMRRDAEFAIRTALGAGRGRLAQQLLAEGLVLASVGGVAGVLVAWVTLPLLLAQLPAALPRLGSVRLDAVALAVTAAATLTLGVIIGLVPVAYGSLERVHGGLREGMRLTRAGHRTARGGLVMTEVAVALMLLVGAGLLGRTVAHLLDRQPGFAAKGLLTLELQAAGSRYDSDEAVWAHHDRLRAAVAALPGVAGVEITSQLPLGGNLDSYGIRAEDRPLANPQLAPSADRYTVSPGFLRTMRIPLVRGRDFSAADDRADALPVAMLSAALAERLWPGEDPLGKRVQLGAPDTPWRTVVGIAGNVRHSGLESDVTQQIYLPARQWVWADNLFTLVVRTNGRPAALVGAVRSAVREVDPSQPITALATMDDVIASSIAQRRLALVLFATFAGAALLLAAFGIYGVLAGNVAERTREIGVRSAIGATPGSILRLVLGQGVRLAAAGILLGCAGALLLARWIESLLFGVTPLDPPTLLAVAGLMLLVAVAACLAPVRRALRVDPVLCLRAD